MIEEVRNGGKLHRPENWQDFEKLARDYYAKIFDSRDVTLNGRQGQNQRGVDIHGRDRFHGNRLVGIQCKGLNDPDFGENKLTSPAKFREEVEKAKKFDPNLKQFILLSTAPDDAPLDTLARQLTEEHKALGLFEVTYHGWGWLEQELRPFPEILRRYGLATFIHTPEKSDVAIKIGERFARYLELANQAGDPRKEISLQSIARHLGETDWRSLERICCGTSLASEAELRKITEALGIDPEWLIDGIGKPFFVQRGVQLSASPDEIRDAVRQMYTDPFHIRAADPGTVEGNVVFTYLDAFGYDLGTIEELKTRYRRGGLGDMVVKRQLEEILQSLLAPIRERRARYASDPAYVMDMLRTGTAAAKEITEATLQEVRDGLGLFNFA